MHYILLYELADDPLETRDRYTRDRADADRLRALLVRYESEMAEVRNTLGEVEPASAGTLDPVLEEKLRALGYID